MCACVEEMGTTKGGVSTTSQGLTSSCCWPEAGIINTAVSRVAVDFVWLYTHTLEKLTASHLFALYRPPP